MKKVLSFLNEYKKESILAPLFKLLEALFDLLVPLVIADIINNGVSNNDFNYIFNKFILLIIMALIGLLCSITAQYFAAKASVGATSKLRQSLFDHIATLSYKELDKLGSDTLITRMTSDTNQIQNGLNLSLRLLLRSPFIVFGAMILAFTIDVKCAIIFAIVIPLLCLVVFFIMLKSIPLFKKVQRYLDGLLSKTRENLTGIRVIRAFRIEEKEVKEFDENNDLLTRQNEVVGRLSALMNPLTYVLINIATVILIYVGAIRVNLGAIESGDVVALYNYMAQIVVELIKMASLIITIDKSIACANRVSTILDVKSSMVYKTENVKEIDTNEAIKFDNVSFNYNDEGQIATLDNISFTLNKGETLGIIGPTGCGKSTFVNLIPRFYDVNNGAIYVDGVNVKDYPKEQLLNKISVVPQKAVLFKASIKDNMLVANKDASDEEIWNALEIAQAKEIVENKEGQLDYQIEQGGRNLSGGQKQRLTIARALLKNSEILILDDSASALDFKTDANLREALSKLNKTIINVSQRASTIKTADKIIVLEDGKMVGFGDHDYLMKNCETYKEIYYSQFPEERKDKKYEEY